MFTITESFDEGCKALSLTLTHYLVFKMWLQKPRIPILRRRGTHPSQWIYINVWTAKKISPWGTRTKVMLKEHFIRNVSLLAKDLAKHPYIANINNDSISLVIHLLIIIFISISKSYLGKCTDIWSFHCED